MNRKIWFVTGASKGLGLTLVKRLLNEGYQVAATSRDIESLIKNIGAPSKNFLPLKVDLGNEKSVGAAVSMTLEKFGTVDVVVNNAGYGQSGAVEQVSDAEARSNYEVNVFGLLNVLRATLPTLRQNKNGHIFNISSIGGFVGGFSGWGVYCSTKFAVSGITEALHADVKAFGINTTLVYPGYFRTNFLEGDSMKLPANKIEDYAEANASMDYHQKSINQNQPGDPEKAAKVMIDLANKSAPPLHMFLGSDSLGMAKQKIHSLQDEVEKWTSTSISTDF